MQQLGVEHLHVLVCDRPAMLSLRLRVHLCVLPAQEESFLTLLLCAEDLFTYF